MHATTLFSNALIERKGACTGLITTEGFRDTLEMRREHKYELYDLFIELPEPLVARRLRLEVPERIGPDGTVETAARRAGAARARARARAGRRRIAGDRVPARLREPGARAARAAKRSSASFRSSSCRSRRTSRRRSASTSARRRRSSTPTSSRSPKAISSLLAGEIAKLGITAPLFMMLSNGGLTHVAEAKRVPVQLLESGPAAGALAGALFGGALEHRGRARLRHGRHDREARDGRERRAADRVSLRSEPRQALRRRQRAAGQDLDDRADRDRRGRRLDRGHRHAGPAQGRAAQRGRRAGPGVLRPRRRASRP